jgi:hypothetical protein
MRPPATWNASHDTIQITNRKTARIRKMKSRTVFYAQQMESEWGENVSGIILVVATQRGGQRVGTFHLAAEMPASWFSRWLPLPSFRRLAAAGR